MEFLGMIGAGILGLSICWRLFLFAFKGIGHGFNTIERKVFKDDWDD